MAPLVTYTPPMLFKDLNILASTCGNSTACVCYLNWTHGSLLTPPPPPPPPNRQMDLWEGSYKHYKHLEAINTLRL